MKLNEIYEGWRNQLLPPEKLKETINRIAAERMAICEGCIMHSKYHSTSLRPDAHCTECGCTLGPKTKCLACACPLDKWKASMTTDQEKEIKNGKG